MLLLDNAPDLASTLGTLPLDYAHAARKFTAMLLVLSSYLKTVMLFVDSDQQCSLPQRTCCGCSPVSPVATPELHLSRRHRIRHKHQDMLAQECSKRRLRGFL